MQLHAIPLSGIDDNGVFGRYIGCMYVLTILKQMAEVLK